MENRVYYDVSGTWTKIPQIKYDSFHYHADTGSTGKIRLGSVCSSYIEFDYYTANGITLNVGDELKYSQVFPEIDNKFEAALTDLEYVAGYFYVSSLNKGSKTVHVTAFDVVSKLNVSFAEHLKSLESSFPMTISDLLAEVETVAGVTFSYGTLNINGMANTPIGYFYASSVTCRDVVKAVAELTYYYVRATLTEGEIKFTDGGGSSNSPWKNSGYYLITPDDGTYQSGDPLDPYYINVWYKENGLTIGEQITPYDGCAIFRTDGTKMVSVGANPYNHYCGNSLFAHQNFNAVNSITQALNYIGINNWYSGEIHLFPFRFPFKVGQIVNVVNTDGNIIKFPIMSLDVSDSEVVIKSFSDKTEGTDNDFNSSGNTYENNSIGLDVRVTDIESKQVLIQSTSITDTTGADGNIGTSLSYDDYIVIAIVRTDSSSVCIPLINVNTGLWIVNVRNSSGSSVVANTSVDVDVFYVPRNNF